MIAPRSKMLCDSTLAARCWTCAAAAFAASFWLVPHTAEAVDTTPEAEDVSFRQKLDEQLPLDAVFRDETGRKLALKEFFGEKPVVLSLVYYECPMLCTLTLNGMLESLHDLKFSIGEEFNVVTISFDHEETHVLAANKKTNYVEQYGRSGAEEGWHFLVGSKASIDRVSEAVGFRFRYDPETDEFAHRSGIVVLTPSGRISRYFPGVMYSARDLRLGLVEASDNKIGSAVDKLFLLCYHYDPEEGKYGLVVTNVVNGACMATVVLVAIFLVTMFGRERRANRLRADKLRA